VSVTTFYRFSYIEDRDALEQYAELLRLSFPGEGVDVLGRRLYNDHPTMTSHNFFSLWDDDRMVATLNLIPMTWSLGGVPLNVAEMGLVATHPDYRHRGLQRLLNEEFDKHIRENGYHLAAIEGIPYFYRQFGYEYAVMLDEWMAISIDKLPSQTMPEIFHLQPDEIPIVMRILETSQRKYFVHSIRSLQEWATQEKAGIVGEHKSTTYVIRVAGEISAYFRAVVEGKAIILYEITETDEAISMGIAAFLRKIGEESGATELVSRVGSVEPLNKYLLDLGASKRRPYAWQMKIVDFKLVLEKIKPVFEERIRRSTFVGYTGMISLNLYVVTVTLTFVDGIVVSVEQSPSLQTGNKE
jgi:predicted acetyltransferase